MKNFLKKLQKLSHSFTEFIDKQFSSKKKTFKFIALFVFTFLFLIEVGIILINNSFYNNFSDDVLQYYSIMVDFVASIKSGTISWFNLNNYFGASFFSDIYYIPLDIFTFITFLLSYIMPTEIAYSITELIKIFAGVMAFSYYLSLKGYKNRTIFWMSIIYFISGGSVSFMAFPVFLSLTFYLPVSLIVIHYFLKGKKWIVPLFVFLIILYDFYLGYTILVFICFAFLIEYFKEYKLKFFKFIKDGALFLALLLLGVSMSAVVLYPSISFILNDTYRATGTFSSWIINIGEHQIKLFQPDIYFRYLAKIFTEQKPIGFYGFENNYGLEHISLYITIIGFAYMCNIFFMKDRISRIYKVTMMIALIFMFFPIFSYVFSGTTDVPYTRWINMLPLLEVIILAHVFEKNGFEKVKVKNMVIIISVLLAIGSFLIYYYIKKLNIDTHYAGRDVMTADTVLMGVAMLILILLMILLIFKKFKIIKLIFWVEFIIGIAYIYSGPFSVANKIETFNTMHSINAFLEESLNDDSQFYRVYVDIDGFKAENLNFNRMTLYPTNTSIFHSWTDKETNEIGYLLYNAWEYQSKEKLNVYGYYLNHFLGYKYILVSSEKNYAFNPMYYTLTYANDKYRLYEIKSSSSFEVYSDYMTYDSFNNFKIGYSNVATQKILCMAALIDSDRYDVSSFGLNQLNPTLSNNSSSISIYKNILPDETIKSSGLSGGAEKDFFYYNEENLNIDFSVGSLYIKSPMTPLEDYGQVYIVTKDGHKNACAVQTGDNDQIKCDFSQQPVGLYIEKVSSMSNFNSLMLRSERAIDLAAYLVYDISGLDTQNSSGVIQFSMMYGYKLGRTFVTDVDGNEYECLSGYFSYDSIKASKLYVFKTNDMYSNSHIFTIGLKYTKVDLSDSDKILDNDNVIDKNLTIKNGKIDLSYNYVTPTTSNQIVMIPVAYSKDWLITNNVNYDTISVSGGFLGIIIPSGTSDVSISMKFVPEGIHIGFAVSGAGILIYLGIFLLPYWIKKKRAKTEMRLNETSKNNSTGL